MTDLTLPNSPTESGPASEASTITHSITQYTRRSMKSWPRRRFGPPPTIRRVARPDSEHCCPLHDSKDKCKGEHIKPENEEVSSILEDATISFSETPEMSRGLTPGRSSMLPLNMYRTFYENSATLSSRVSKDTHVRHRENEQLRLQDDNAFQTVGEVNLEVNLTKEGIQRHLVWNKKKSPSGWISMFEGKSHSERRARFHYKDSQKIGQRVTIAEISTGDLIPATVHGTCRTHWEIPTRDKYFAKTLHYSVTTRHIDMPVWVHRSARPADGSSVTLEQFKRSGAELFVSIKELRMSNVVRGPNNHSRRRTITADGHNYEWLALGRIPESRIEKVIPFDGTTFHDVKPSGTVRSEDATDDWIYDFDMETWRLESEMLRSNTDKRKKTGDHGEVLETSTDETRKCKKCKTQSLDFSVIETLFDNDNTVPALTHCMPSSIIIQVKCLTLDALQHPINAWGETPHSVAASSTPASSLQFDQHIRVLGAEVRGSDLRDRQLYRYLTLVATWFVPPKLKGLGRERMVRVPRFPQPDLHVCAMQLVLKAVRFYQKPHVPAHLLYAVTMATTSMWLDRPWPMELLEAPPSGACQHPSNEAALMWLVVSLWQRFARRTSPNESVAANLVPDLSSAATFIVVPRAPDREQGLPIHLRFFLRSSKLAAPRKCIEYLPLRPPGETVGVTTELTVADIPPCGLRCLFIVLPASGCLPTDVECICASKSLEQELAACLLANCTMQDALDTSRVQADLCDLSEESKTKQVLLYTCIVYSIAFLSVALRVAGKAVSQRLAWDDAMVVAALFLTAVPLGFVLDMVFKGFGDHLWNLHDGKLLPILRNLYISWSAYVIVLCMIKISLVLFYLEIFKTPRFRMTAFIFLGYLITNSLVIFFIAICACTPIPSFWNRDIKGKCINIQGAAYANSGSAIVQDIMLLIMPLAFIRNLQMKRFRKIAVGFMFVVGTFGCIATIMRLPSLSSFQISIDPSWDYVPITIWTELELAAGFLCVSLPSIRILLVRILPKRFINFFSNITSRSRSRSNPTPAPNDAPQPRKWHKPASWFETSPNNTNFSDESTSTGKGLEPLTLGSGVRGSFMGSFWNRSTNQPSQFSGLRSGTYRLGSAMSNYSESGYATTRPPFQEERNQSIVKQVEQVELEEMNEAPNRTHRHTNSSCRTCTSDHDQITALPQIGCIPETLFSELDFSKYSTSPTSQYQASPASQFQMSPASKWTSRGTEKGTEKDMVSTAYAHATGVKRKASTSFVSVGVDDPGQRRRF
ncbi:hypothetical protein OPT61_g7220 [Boeremia exigua]|uniref:Uncharacterized protein n=1 Tax=Boeremia exigua TaxID=749465 RepID=A0ACC2I354_9PLEO|nr:hypothetical protein OPT61_g7220 [Boeremia exigua]